MFIHAKNELWVSSANMMMNNLAIKILNCFTLLQLLYLFFWTTQRCPYYPLVVIDFTKYIYLLGLSSMTLRIFLLIKSLNRRS